MTCNTNTLSLVLFLAVALSAAVAGCDDTAQLSPGCSVAIVGVGPAPIDRKAWMAVEHSGCTVTDLIGLKPALLSSDPVLLVSDESTVVTATSTCRIYEWGFGNDHPRVLTPWIAALSYDEVWVASIDSTAILSWTVGAVLPAWLSTVDGQWHMFLDSPPSCTPPGE
jgi:hypothetical protein